MRIEDVLDMLQTRLQVADKNGNTTEKSLLYELYKMVEELKEKRENENAKH